MTTHPAVILHICRGTLQFLYYKPWLMKQKFVPKMLPPVNLYKRSDYKVEVINKYLKHFLSMLVGFMIFVQEIINAEGSKQNNKFKGMVSSMRFF